MCKRQLMLYAVLMKCLDILAQYLILLDIYIATRQVTIGFLAVSYTHLDVYKRQVIESAHSNGVGCVSVECEVTHQVNGRLKDKHQI